MNDGFDQHGTDPEAVERAVVLLKALSHVGRLQILCHLLGGEMNVGELSDAMRETQASISQQLMRLRAEGLVRPHRAGKHIVYRLARDDVAPVIEALRQNLCRAPGG